MNIRFEYRSGLDVIHYEDNWVIYKKTNLKWNAEHKTFGIFKEFNSPAHAIKYIKDYHGNG